MATYLTKLDAGGGFKGTVRVPNAYDVAWNGEQYGLVHYDEASTTVSFHRLHPNGRLVASDTIATERLHYLSFPKVAASGSSFGLVWAVDGKDGKMALRFAPVSCK
jgi:hypothetical protein